MSEFFEYDRNNEALRLIQHMDDDHPEDWDGTAIRAELRRLHEAHDWQYQMAADRLRRIEKLKAERDAAVKLARDYAREAYKDVKDWSSYASEHFQSKWNRDADLAKWHRRDGDLAKWLARIADGKAIEGPPAPWGGAPECNFYNEPGAGPDDTGGR